MYISDTLSRATSDNVAPGGAHGHRTICLLQQEQNFFADINQADYLNFTDQRLHQLIQHTDSDATLQALKSIVLRGWPDEKEAVPGIVREYWSF